MNVGKNSISGSLGRIITVELVSPRAVVGVTREGEGKEASSAPFERKKKKEKKKKQNKNPL
jgi:hypothetical protein